MAYFEQAPVLLKNGVKERSGLFAYRPHELEYAICCCLGDRDMVPLKTMLFFTGNSNDGDFRIAQKTIFDRMKISEKRYYEARKKLEEMGWIHYDSRANAIYVNYDKIYADYKEYRENKARVCNDSPTAVSTHDCPVVMEFAERSLKPEESSHDDSQSGGRQDRHNNINNNIKNNINNKISGGAGAANAAPPQEELIKQMKEDDKKIYEWAKIELQRINAIFDYPSEPSELNAMHSSDEYKQYLKELEKKRIPLRKKYGKLYEW